MAKVPYVFSLSMHNTRGTWRFHTSKGAHFAQCTCPTCGKNTNIPLEKVHKTGITSAPLDCSYGGCSFHDEILLRTYTTQFLSKDPKITKKNR